MPLKMTQLVIDEVTKDELIKLGIKEEWLNDIPKYRNKINEYLNDEEYNEIEKKEIGDYFLTGEVYTIVDKFEPKEDKFYVTEDNAELSIFTPGEIKKLMEECSGDFEVEIINSQPQIREVM